MSYSAYSSSGSPPRVRCVRFELVRKHKIKMIINAAEASRMIAKPMSVDVPGTGEGAGGGSGGEGPCGGNGGGLSSVVS